LHFGVGDQCVGDQCHAYVKQQGRTSFKLPVWNPINPMLWNFSTSPPGLPDQNENVILLVKNYKLLKYQTAPNRYIYITVR
jgi:hypothetical protein